jgi:hypothetical protein
LIIDVSANNELRYFSFLTLLVDLTIKAGKTILLEKCGVDMKMH